MNFVVVAALTVCMAWASTHLERWSMATMIYLDLKLLTGSGPITSIEKVCHTNFGFTSSNLVACLKGFLAWQSLKQFRVLDISKFIDSQ